MTTVSQIAPPSPHLAGAAAFYPETDGEPLPDGERQAPLYQEIVPALAMQYRGQPRTRVNGNTFIYYAENDLNLRVSPDCYVAFDVDVDIIETHNSYRIWAVGKPPDFVLEIASESTAQYDITEKRRLYAQIGIREYWRFDATGGDFYHAPLVGEYLGADGEYHPIAVAPDAAGRPCGYSSALGLFLCWDNGRLRFYDPSTGEWLRNFAEERAYAAAERAARAAAEARVAELEAELRRLRGH